METYERTQKIAFINFQGRIYGTIGAMVGDIPIWYKDKEFKPLSDDELDELFKVLYEYREQETKFMHAKHLWERTVNAILDQKAMDDVAILYGQMKASAEAESLRSKTIDE